MFNQHELKFSYKDDQTTVQMYHPVTLPLDAIRRITNVILEETDKATMDQLKAVRRSTEPVFSEIKDIAYDEIKPLYANPAPIKREPVYDKQPVPVRTITPSVSEEEYGQAYSLNELPDTAFLINECPKCDKRYFTKKATLWETCNCGEPISRTKKEWLKINYKCPNCGMPGFGYSTVNLTEVSCGDCGSPIDIKVKKNKMVGGSLLSHK